MEKKDPEAILKLGLSYDEGSMGLQQDIAKALELFHKAADLGAIDAHNILGTMYYNGHGVQEDRKKGKYHWEVAAMRGNVLARYNLGALESMSGNNDRAIKHLMISANAGEMMFP